MRYAFVSLSILAIWIAIVLLVVFLDLNTLMLPLVALIMTITLFEIGFGGKKWVVPYFYHYLKNY